MTKLILLLGFLGSGKTTLMHRILDKYAGKKIGILINDFGKLNVDSILLERNGVPMQELSNGSIFCACIKANFYDSLVEMSAHELEYLFIEASGLVDPSSMPDILDAIALRVKSPYNFNGSVCVVDLHNFIKLLNVFPAVGNQIDYADAIILNKSDLADEITRSEVKKKINELNPRADIFITSHCDVDVVSIVESLCFSRDTDRESSNTYESRPKSLMIEGDGVFDRTEIENLIKDISAHAYRIKGFAETDKGAVEIHAVGDGYSIQPWDKKIDKTQIVVISSVGLGIINVVNERIKNIAGLKMII